MTCTLTHRYEERLSDLPPSQGGDQRHKCCGCAYDLGKIHGRAGTRLTINWDSINESQAGTGRHKDAEEAYVLGYADGAKEIREAK